MLLIVLAVPVLRSSLVGPFSRLLVAGEVMPDDAVPRRNVGSLNGHSGMYASLCCVKHFIFSGVGPVLSVRFNASGAWDDCWIFGGI